MAFNKDKVFIVKELKQIIDGVNDEAVVLFGIGNEIGKREIIPMAGYDYVHTMAKSSNIFDIIGRGMSCSKEGCNIIYLYDGKYGDSKFI